VQAAPVHGALQVHFQVTKLEDLLAFRDRQPARQAA
jgi:hypothetical protein